MLAEIINYETIPTQTSTKTLEYFKYRLSIYFHFQC